MRSLLGVSQHDEAERSRKSALLQDIIENCSLTAVFQPIVDMRSGSIMGYEGLIRGPSDSPLHAPIALLQTAEMHGRLFEIERLCRKVTLESFMRLNLGGRLFLNISPECLIEPLFKDGETLKLIHSLGINPDKIIIELTEAHPTYDYPLLRDAVNHYRNMGFRVAIDDLGEGFSNLRLWSELRPDFVKIDMHFVQGINQDSVKHQFVSSIQQIAEKTETRVIAEGIETFAELAVIKNLNIALGQGYLVGRPNANPIVAVSTEIIKALTTSSRGRGPYQKSAIARKILKKVVPVSSHTPNQTVFQIFTENPELHSLPVVDSMNPVGLLKRHHVIENFARPFVHELFGKKHCSTMMDASPMIVDQNISLHDLSNLIVSSGRHHLLDGFVITDHGKYVGMGSAHDLMREITEIQINTARYANPLTLLPGNVPINEHIDMLLENNIPFCACYCDLDNFKPFNDVYGYRKGDDMIQLCGEILAEGCDIERDFIGHIGGDDFIVLFQSQDWQKRCGDALERFDAMSSSFFSEAHRNDNGFTTQDRRGEKVFVPITSLSIGAVPVFPGTYDSHHEISEAAATAKKNAKKIPGSSLFIERRKQI
ncbi:MAG: GGDEF domain-containing protein [Burkholderiales bacterium]|nr:GGDEF domain-containing protein [Burkholderiales bacterium]